MSAGLSIVELYIERGIHRAFYDDIRREIEAGVHDDDLAREVRNTMLRCEEQRRACQAELESVREAREMRLTALNVPHRRLGMCRNRRAAHRRSLYAVQSAEARLPNADSCTDVR